MVIPSFFPAEIYGGTITSSLKTCQNLARLGNDVKVSTTNTNMYNHLDVEKNRYVLLEQNLKVKYYHDTILDRFSIPLFFNVHKDIHEADVVHIQSIFNSPTPLALMHASRKKKPILLSPRGVLSYWIMHQGIPFKKPWLNIFIKPFARNIIWHATSEQEKEEILTYFPDAKIHIIPNGIDLSEFGQTKSTSNSEYFKKYFKENMLSPVIVSMGRIHKKKGFDILIRAFNSILPKFPNARLLIAGEDEGEKKSLQKLIYDLNLQDKVAFVGMIKGKDKIDFLTNSDLFVLPSHNENFGNVYAEALAAGTPIIASKSTPWQEVESKNCGKWVENSVDATANAMSELLNEDLQELGNNGIDHIQQYSWQNIGKRFDELFDQMIKEKR